MVVLYMITALAFVLSLCKSPAKTWQAMVVAWRRFVKVAPAFIQIVCMVSLILYFVPDEMIGTCLGAENRWVALSMGAVLGSLVILPGFIAFPLAAKLLHMGAAYMVISAFTTTVMMVGLATVPLERTYFGLKVTVIRNAIGLLIALAVALATGWVFGELV